jgi:lysozyme
MRKLSNTALNLICSFEGLKLKPYKDSTGIPTIGYGTILYPNNKPVTMHDPEITEVQAKEYLEFQVAQKCTGVEHMVKVSINDNEFGALVSFAYNLGLGALHGSTLLRLLNAGQDRKSVADQFLKWNKAGGVEIAGLTRRRQAERALFLQSVVDSSKPSPTAPSDLDIINAFKKIEDDI